MTDKEPGHVRARVIEVPPQLAALHLKHWRDSGPAWTAALPGLAESFLDRWDLRLDGPPMHGVVALVLPVVRADGLPAALKLQPVTAESAGEPAGLRAWAGDGAVLLLESDPSTGTMLLERLRPRCLDDVADPLPILAGLLRRLTAHPAPPGLRTLGDVAAAMLGQVPAARSLVPDPLIDRCAGAVRDLMGEPGDRLLHWDLHYRNVLAGEREEWLAIDPKPLAGDPGFDLLPALVNQWDPAQVRWRFDQLTEALGLDRRKAAGWTLGRVLQNTLWDVEDGARAVDPVQRAVADALPW